MRLNRKLGQWSEKKLSPRKDRRQTLMSSLRFMPGAWMLVDRRFATILATSSELDELLGCRCEPLIGKDVDTITPEAPAGDGWASKRLDLELLSHPGRYEEVALRDRDGRDIVVDVRVSHPDKVGEGLTLCMITDRTQQMNLQSQLIEKHQELRRAFSQLELRSDQLSRTKQMLLHRNKEMAELFAQLRSTSGLATIGEITAELTHQLNNPLAAAFGAARRLRKLSEKGTTEKMPPMLDLLDTGLERMRVTIDELRQVYRNSRVSVEPSGAIRLENQIRSALSLLQQSLEGVDVQIDIPEESAFVVGHGRQIQHVLVNLLDNAVEFVPRPGGEIYIEAERSENGVRLRIGDNGPGIPAGDMDKVFEAFFTTRDSGTGLGLAVVKRYLDRDRAKIEARRSRLGGAEFAIEFQSAGIEETEE